MNTYSYSYSGVDQSSNNATTNRIKRDIQINEKRKNISSNNISDNGGTTSSGNNSRSSVDIKTGTTRERMTEYYKKSKSVPSVSIPTCTSPKNNVKEIHDMRKKRPMSAPPKSSSNRNNFNEVVDTVTIYEETIKSNTTNYLVDDAFTATGNFVQCSEKIR